MKAYKIYGVNYKLKQKPMGDIDAFAYKGQIVDNMPKTKILGYVKMEDGSIVQCHDTTNLLIIILPIVALLVIGGIGIAVYFLLHADDPPELELDEITGERITTEGYNNVCAYQGFMTVNDQELNIEFQNGDYPATVVVEGEGIETKTTQVPAKGYLATIPIHVTTKDAVVSANITIKTSTSSASYPVVVEIPKNNNGNDSNEGLSGAWSREDVYISYDEVMAAQQASEDQ